MAETISRAAIRSEIKKILKHANLMNTSIDEVVEQLEIMFGPLDTRRRQVQHLILKYTRSKFRVDQRNVKQFFEMLELFLCQLNPNAPKDQLQNIKANIRAEMEKNGTTEDWAIIHLQLIKFFNREFGDLPRNNVLRRAFCR